MLRPATSDSNGSLLNISVGAGLTNANPAKILKIPLRYFCWRTIPTFQLSSR